MWYSIVRYISKSVDEVEPTLYSSYKWVEHSKWFHSKGPWWFPNRCTHSIKGTTWDTTFVISEEQKCSLVIYECLDKIIYISVFLKRKNIYICCIKFRHSVFLDVIWPRDSIGLGNEPNQWCPCLTIYECIIKFIWANALVVYIV